MHHQIHTATALWDNVLSLMLKHYGKENQSRLASECEIGLGTISRIKQKKTSVGLDVIEKIATRFDLAAWQLLVPGMDPSHPPALQPVNERERLLYEKLMAAAQQLVAESDPPYKTDKR